MREAMGKFRFVVVVSCLLARAFCSEVCDAKGVAGKLGEKVEFVDTVHEVVIKDSGTIFLNFGGDYPDEVFAAVVMKDTHPRFPGIESWIGKKVHVEGVVSDYEGHHRIILRERGQISLVPEQN